MRLYYDLHILIERHEKTQKALNGKLPEFTAQHLRHIGLTDAEQICGLNLLQTPIFQDRVDLEYKLRLDQVLFRIGNADVFEHVAASVSYLFLLMTSRPGDGSAGYSGHLGCGMMDRMTYSSRSILK